VALATFLQLLRPHSLEGQRAQRFYRAEAERIARQVRETFDDWLALREYESDNMQLANAAAVSRWELIRLVKGAEQLDAPVQCWRFIATSRTR